MIARGSEIGKTTGSVRVTIFGGGFDVHAQRVAIISDKTKNGIHTIPTPTGSFNSASHFFDFVENDTLCTRRGRLKNHPKRDVNYSQRTGL